ncbi:MAG: hypothetical protein JJE30_18640 [Desulfuromonadales bacterium]|nr:hypothetical protein [Desulfuromonadales bacterium]
MKVILWLFVCMIPAGVSLAHAAGDYRGDDRCPPPKDWSEYSEPYNPLDHASDYPVFYKSDWPGWSCSYTREDGVIVQYGDSRSPQEQWIAVWSNGNDN